jgi:kynurenine formamidase
MTIERWSDEMLDEWLVKRRNWQRWGPDDQLGATNLIDDAKRLAATRLVRTGQTISLSGLLPTEQPHDDIQSTRHFIERYEYAAVDYVDMPIHGNTSTHLDAFNHIWDKDGMWNGKQPEEVLKGNKPLWGDVDVWRDGIVTRGVLIDIPGYRNQPYVTFAEPVTAGELDRILKAQRVAMEPGDAVVFYSGREALVEERGSWGVWDADSDYRDYVLPQLTEAGIPPRGPGRHHHAGLDISCLKFIRENDCAVVVWDMHDASEHDYPIPWTVHSTIWAYGTAVVDAARLDRLAQACREQQRWEFMLVVAPLRIRGGTGSPINPIAIL